MAREQEYPALSRALDWALERMAQAGYPVKALVTLQVDPTLRFMGYAKHEGGQHVIVAAGWALDSEMFGGFLLHELAHIYYTERQKPSHQSQLVNEVLSDIIAREGLTSTEAGYLTDAFNHLQNILADDIIFAILRSEREIRQVQRFFANWISDRPSGDPRADAALLARNAFAIASLKRRDLYEAVDVEMSSKNKQFLTFYGKDAEKTFVLLENFLEKARSNWNAKEFRRALIDYLGRMVALMRREGKAWEDLR